MMAMTTIRTMLLSTVKIIGNLQHAGKTTFVNVIASGQFNEDMVIMINVI